MSRLATSDVARARTGTRALQASLRKLTIVLAVGCVVPAAAQQQVFKQGADLHEALQQDTAASSNAMNYIVGVVDALNGTRTRDGACFDLKGAEGVTGSRIAQVVRAFLLKDPQMKERSGSSAVAAALEEAWPCK